MTTNSIDVLIVGPQGPFWGLFSDLAEQRRYNLHFASDYELAWFYLNDQVPAAIVLTMRMDGQDVPEKLACLDIMKKIAPVLVVSPAEDLALRMTVADHGASGFFTAHSPVEEISRALDRAAGAIPAQATSSAA